MRKVAMIILDGYGLSEKTEGNAIKNANTPYFDYLRETFPFTTLGASGPDVDLPPKIMGNSEVGHSNLGAGRLVEQSYTVITNKIKNGDFFKNPSIVGAFDHAKQNNSDVHILGLCSNGVVHSSIDHMFELLKLAKQENFERVYIHFITDGRDTAVQSGLGFMEQTLDKIKEYGVGKIATVGGRYYIMDREKRYERVKVAYDAMINGVGNTCEDPITAIKQSYENNVNDEFIIPTIITEEGKPVAQIKSNDSLIFFNYRTDRVKEIMNALTDSKFDKFETANLENNYILNFTKYGDNYPTAKVAFPEEVIPNNLGEYLSNKGYTQLRVAEETKYPHVTFFFNGRMEKPYPNETRNIVKGLDVKTWDLAPKMSAQGVEDYILENVDDKKYDFVLLNFANCDMVGHTGNYDASVTAVEFLDEKLRNLIPHFVKNGYQVIVTADHGNAEELLNKDGSICTKHTLNRVPFIVVTEQDLELKEGGRLSNVSSTILELMEVEKPSEYEESLILKK